MTRPTPRFVAEAARWAAEMDAGPLDAGQQESLDAWRARDPRHGQALARMRRFDESIGGLDPVLGLALKRVLNRRRRVRRTAPVILGVVATALAAILAAQSFAVQSRFPDHVTVAGEQRTLSLADGSSLTLDTATSADVSGRRVRLFEGRVLARVARRPGEPFVVETRHGAATALGTAYAVSADDTAMRVTVTESQVQVCAPGGQACETLAPGQRAEVRNGVVRRLAPVSPEVAAAWASGWLEADDMAAADALAELARYRPAPLRFDRADLAGVRVTGSFPLTAPDRALRALADSGGLTLSQEADGATRVARAK